MSFESLCFSSHGILSVNVLISSSHISFKEQKFQWKITMSIIMLTRMIILVQRNYHVRRSGIYFHLILLFGTNSMTETGEVVATDISLVYWVRAVVLDLELRNNGNQIVLWLNIYIQLLQMQEQ